MTTGLSLLSRLVEQPQVKAPEVREAQQGGA
jgi:hypothetical protein